MLLSQKLQNRIIADNIRDFVPLAQGVILSEGQQLFGEVNTYNIKVINGNHLIDSYQSSEVLTNVVIDNKRSGGSVPAALQTGDSVLVGFLNGDKNAPYIIGGGSGTMKNTTGYGDGDGTEEEQVDTEQGDPPSNASAAIAMSVDLSNVQILEILEKLPTDLSSKRKIILDQALRAVGIVDYFWGGRYHEKGSCPEWGELKIVLSVGSSTTGSSQPYGLDCSGFTDWAYYQADVDLKTGTTYNQFDMGTPVTFANALPGDLVFNESKTHVGIYVGVDADGKILTVDSPKPGCKVTLADQREFTQVIRIDGVE